jgi:hypothetical protein
MIKKYIIVIPIEKNFFRPAEYAFLTTKNEEIFGRVELRTG